jgi:phosphoenolpyruvate synthase/pyruvate phosphate dikinase
MEDNPPTILWLGEADCGRRELVGGKAANLSRLAAGYRVPPGFCLTAVAFQEAGLGDRRGSLFDDVAAAYREIARQNDGSEPGVAVRSSAIDEDGLSVSFAGQYESILNVVGAEAIYQAIERCWASANADRVRAYRQERGLDSAVPVAVLVQHLIPADASAIVFSSNPVNNDDGQIVINASWGLGESIVGGTVTPDTYVVDKARLSLVSTHIADKERMTVRSEGGTQEVGVPRFLRGRPALDEEQILEAARLALDLEREMGWPADVECAYQDGELYLLQCRPVTTLDSGQVSV